MKSILKVLLNWKNWNNREVGNTYRFVSEDNFLFINEGRDPIEHGYITIKATISGMERETTILATGTTHTIDSITSGTDVVISWEGKISYLQINDVLLFGTLPERQYRYQTKTEIIDIEKSTGDGVVSVTYENTMSQSRTILMNNSTPTLHVTDAKIGRAVKVSWESTVSYLKVNDKVIVG